MPARAPARPTVARSALFVGALALLLAACSSEGVSTTVDTTSDATPAALGSSNIEAARTTATPGTPGASSPRPTGAEGTSPNAASPRPSPAPSPPLSSTPNTPSGAGSTPPAPPPGQAGGPSGQTVGIDCVAPVLKRHPIDLAPYDASTGRAGDARFARPLFLNRVYTEFGFVIPAASTSSGNDKPNPQPTYLAPMGTKVRSAVDGVVDRIADLWSTPTLGDVSVMVKPDGLAGRCYVVVEFEHVVKPTVRAGDRVAVGQVIAEVGPLNSQGSAGLGLVEFGILTGSGNNGRPLHVCPYAYFDPAVRTTQLAILGRLMADWEAYFGDSTLYNEAGWAGGVTGCRSGPIEE